MVNLKRLKVDIFKFIFSLIVFVIIFSCSNTEKIEQTKKLTYVERGKIPDNEIWNLEFVITKEGKLVQKVTSGHIRQFLKGTRKNISYVDSGLKLDFYKNNKHQGVLTSNKGVLDQKRGVFKALENVVMLTPDKYTLYTEELVLYRNRNQIKTDKPVMMVDSTKVDTLFGDGFISDLNFISYELINPKGKAYINKETMKKF